MEGLQVRIGQRIRQRREELGMTQQELAGAELTRGFISQLEKGIVLPSLKSLELIASRLCRPLSYFLEEGPQAPPGAQAGGRMQLFRLAEHHLFSGETALAAEALARARDEPPQPPAPREAAWADTLEARIAWQEGRVSAARELLADAVDRLRAAGDFAALAVASAYLGELMLAEGHPAQAAAVLDEALRIAVRHGVDSPHEVLRIRVLCAIAWSRAGRPKALEALEAAAALGARTGWWFRPGELLVALGSARLRSARAAEARLALEGAAAWAVALQEPQTAGWAYRLLAQLAGSDGQGGETVELLKRAVASFQQAQDSEQALASTCELAQALADRGRIEEALDRCREALERYPAGAERVPVLVLAGRLLERVGRGDEARQRLEEAVRLAAQAGRVRELAGALSELGNLLRRLGEHALAGEYLSRAVSLYASAETG